MIVGAAAWAVFPFPVFVGYWRCGLGSWRLECVVARLSWQQQRGAVDPRSQNRHRRGRPPAPSAASSLAPADARAGACRRRWVARATVFLLRSRRERDRLGLPELLVVWHQAGQAPTRAMPQPSEEQLKAGGVGPSDPVYPTNGEGNHPNAVRRTSRAIRRAPCRAASAKAIRLCIPCDVSPGNSSVRDPEGEADG
jgi:hypothetical protein